MTEAKAKPVTDEDDDEKLDEEIIKKEPALKSPRAALTELERMRAELAATRAENAELKAAAATETTEARPGKKYKISLKDHVCVVQPREGESPIDCLKRLGGIQETAAPVEMSEAAEHELCGTYIKDRLVVRW